MFALNIEVSDDQVIREMTKIKWPTHDNVPWNSSDPHQAQWVGSSYRGQGLVIEKAQYIAGNPRTFPQYIHHVFTITTINYIHFSRAIM